MSDLEAGRLPEGELASNLILTSVNRYEGKRKNMCVFFVNEDTREASGPVLWHGATVHITFSRPKTVVFRYSNVQGETEAMEVSNIRETTGRVHFDKDGQPYLHDGTIVLGTGEDRKVFETTALPLYQLPFTTKDVVELIRQTKGTSSASD